KRWLGRSLDGDPRDRRLYVPHFRERAEARRCHWALWSWHRWCCGAHHACCRLQAGCNLDRRAVRGGLGADLAHAVAHARRLPRLSVPRDQGRPAEAGPAEDEAGARADVCVPASAGLLLWSEEWPGPF